MDLQLFSIEQTPKALPIWDRILEDLGRPDAPRIARALGVGRSTVYRWNQVGSGPRVACLALFWLTRWGRSEVHTQATNDAMLAAQLARALAQERDELRARVAQLEALLPPVAVPPLLATAAPAAPAAVARVEPSAVLPGAGPGPGATLQWPRLDFDGPSLDLDGPAPIEVLPQRHGQECVQRDAQLPGVGLGLGVQRLGEADVGGHLCDSSTRTAPFSHQSPGTRPTCMRRDKPSSGDTDGAAPGASGTLDACRPAPGPGRAYARGGTTAPAPRSAEGFQGAHGAGVTLPAPHPRPAAAQLHPPQASAGPSGCAGSPLRSLDAPSHGAAPHAPAPGAPGRRSSTAAAPPPAAEAGRAVFAALASSITTHPTTKPRTRP